MNSVFSEQILADKLSKLNSTQHCIEKLVVETWIKQFQSSEKEQKVSFLYLVNDLLQNSRRKGTKFVSEFWKVLPSALKNVVEHKDDRGKNAFNRLKVAIGGTAEKILSVFHAVFSEHMAEDLELTKCKTTVCRVQKMEKDINNACKQGVRIRECSHPVAETVVNNDHVNRQRRWSSETSEISESPSSSQASSTSPYDMFPKHAFNLSDSTNSRDTAKERVGR